MPELVIVGAFINTGSDLPRKLAKHHVLLHTGSACEVLDCSDDLCCGWVSASRNRSGWMVRTPKWTGEKSSVFLLPAGVVVFGLISSRVDVLNSLRVRVGSPRSSATVTSRLMEHEIPHGLALSPRTLVAPAWPALG